MRHVPRAVDLGKAIALWVRDSRYVNYLEQGAYGVHTWALFESGGQVGLIRLRVGESIGYNGVGKDIVECL